MLVVPGTATTEDEEPRVHPVPVNVVQVKELVRVDAVRFSVVGATAEEYAAMLFAFPELASELPCDWNCAIVEFVMVERDKSDHWGAPTATSGAAPPGGRPMPARLHPNEVPGRPGMRARGTSGDGLNIYLGYTQVTSGPNTVGVEPLGGISFTAGGKIAYSTFTSAGPTAYGGWQTPEQGMAYQHNSWYKVDIVYSAVTFQYDLWVNNVLVGENLTFWEGPDAPLEIVLGSCVQDGGCYQGNTATVTAYVDDLSVQEYSTQTQGIYTSSLIPNFPGTVENATVSWNATVPIHTSLQVEVTNGALSGGSPVWVHVPSSGANVSFLDEGASQQFGYRLLFYSTDPRYSPLFFSLRATIGTIAVSGVGETAVFDSTGLNLSGTVTASTYSDFLTKGSSLSTGPVPYAPGDPGNNTLDPSGVLDNGHLELSLEEGFQDNFDTPASTSAGTTGNYSITEYSGGTAPTWSESSTASVSAPNSANYVETASGGLVYNYYGIQGTSGDAISAGQFSFDLRIASGGASILGGGVSGKSLYTVFAVTFQAGLTSVTDGTVFNSNVRFTYHTGVWYSCLFTFNNVANTFSFYINASVDWGDGGYDHNYGVGTMFTHTYSASGTYLITAWTQQQSASSLNVYIGVGGAAPAGVVGMLFGGTGIAAAWGGGGDGAGAGLVGVGATGLGSAPYYPSALEGSAVTSTGGYGYWSDPSTFVEVDSWPPPVNLPPPPVPPSGPSWIPQLPPPPLTVSELGSDSLILPSGSGSVDMSAVLDVQGGDPSQPFTYSWKADGAPLQSVTGGPSSSITHWFTSGGPHTLTVTVSQHGHMVLEKTFWQTWGGP